MSGIAKQPKDPLGSPVNDPQDLNPDSQNPVKNDDKTKPEDTSEDLDKKLPAEEKEPQATIPQDDSDLETVELDKQDDSEDLLEPPKKDFKTPKWLKNLKAPNTYNKLLQRMTPSKADRPVKIFGARKYRR